MTQPTITLENFTKGLEQAVEQRGVDYVYDREKYGFDWAGQCMYSLDGEPACIVGLALHNIDPALMPSDYSMEAADSLLSGMRADGRLSDTPARMEALIRAAYDAQDVQDGGGTWGEALTRYARTVGVELDAQGADVEDAA